MIDDKTGVVFDTLFVGATRPPMRWGVTYVALIVNMVCTMEIFVLSRNLLMLLIAIPIHGLCVLFCARDAKFFELAFAWCRTRLPALASTYAFWRASSYSPIELDAPSLRGRRRVLPYARI